MDWKAEELERLKNLTPESVPLWPLLPMKNPKMRKTNGFPMIGVLVAWDKKPIVYKAYVTDLGARQWVEPREDGPNYAAVELKGVMEVEAMPDLRDKLSKFEKFEYESFEALQEAGWEVD